jgi:hypothetical protein
MNHRTEKQNREVIEAPSRPVVKKLVNAISSVNDLVTQVISQQGVYV